MLKNLQETHSESGEESERGKIHSEKLIIHHEAQECWWISYFSVKIQETGKIHKLNLFDFRFLVCLWKLIIFYLSNNIFFPPKKDCGDLTLLQLMKEEPRRSKVLQQQQ